MPQVNQFVQQLMHPLKRLSGNRNPRAYTQGLVPYRQKQWQLAVECFTQAITEQPDHAPSHFKLGMSHFRLKEHESASAAITRALELDPRQKQWQEQLDQVARYLVKLPGQTPSEKAKIIRNQIESLDSPSAMLYNELAHAFRNQFKWDQEVESLQVAVYKDASQPTWFYRLGEALEKKCCYRQAAKAYQKAIDVRGVKTSASWYYQLGYAHEAHGLDGPPELDEAQHAYREAIFKDKKLNSKQLGIGVFHEQRSLWKEAKSAYHSELNRQPWNAELNYRLGLAHDRCYEWEKAEILYKRALSLNVQKPEWHFRLGFVLEKQERLNESVLAYQYAAHTSETHMPYWFYKVGNVFQKQGRYQEAIDSYVKIHHQQDLSVDLLTNVSFDTGPIHDYLCQFNNQQFFIDELLGRLKKNNDDFDLWSQLGSIYELQFDWKKAKKAYETAIEKSYEWNPINYYRAGYVNSKLEDNVEACYYFSKVMGRAYLEKEVLREKALSVMVQDINLEDSVYNVEILVTHKTSIKDLQVGSLFLKSRESFDRKLCDIEFKKIHTKFLGKQVVCSFELDPSANDIGFLYHDLYLDLVVTYEDFVDSPITIKSSVGSEGVIKNLKDYPLDFSVRKEANIFYPYVTASGKSISFINREHSDYDARHYYLVEKEAISDYEKNKQELTKRKAWLVFEKFSNTAQDNAYYFFKSIVNKRPHVYYVIEKDSPDRKYLAGYEDNVVEFMSKKHMVLLLSCQLLISSETRGHVYPWRRVFGRFREAVFKKPYVFLQHGVTAMKKNDANLSKRSHICAADKFVVSSEFEKEIILKENFGYLPSEIIVSGFPRWDTFVDNSKNYNNIFLMPTWRNWLEGLNDEEFKCTEYFKEYTSLLSSTKLTKLLEKFNCKLNFYLHPKIIEQLKNFDIDSELIKLIKFGEAPVRDLLMDSKLLITDYSSVAWDFYYLKKPVLFFHFDESKYLKYHGSHIDFSSELPTKAVKNGHELIDKIGSILENYSAAKNEAECIGENLFREIMNQDSSNVIYESLMQLKK